MKQEQDQKNLVKSHFCMLGHGWHSLTADKYRLKMLMKQTGAVSGVVPTNSFSENHHVSSGHQKLE